jgi:hypothetical protein
MDKKAEKILFKIYRKNEWVDYKDNIITKEEFEYAKSKGVMFDNISITHDECINEIIEMVGKISMEKVSKAFLSSLSTKHLDWRSSVASHFLAKQFTKHTYSKLISGRGHCCKICKASKYEIVGHEKYINKDLNVLNYERIKWTGARHGDLLYTLLDLRVFSTEEIPEPTNEDIIIFKNILKTIEKSQQKDYPGALEKRLSECIKSTKEERQKLMEILACIEILKPGSYDRPTTGRHDWHYVEFWRGEDGYNQNAVNKYFGKYL